MIMKKINAMRVRYGSAEGVCGTCPHFLRYLYHDKRLLKCKAYGLTHSEATDWRVSYPACGLKDKELPEDFTPVFDLVKGKRAYVPLDQLDGQVGMDI